MVRTRMIECSEETSETTDRPEDIMVDRIVTYFTRPDPEGHRRSWKKRKRTEMDENVDRYYI
ncbi:MAG: hypothetical protein JXA22_00710 [Candidatus Thermoplasmatota archaeon]|nr:hypothetical protein [Candidatus Thermoplasmatota archaeon]